MDKYGICNASKEELLRDNGVRVERKHVRDNRTSWLRRCSKNPTPDTHLCLYRVVTECCAGRVLPLGIRQMIKAYAWVSVDDKSLWEAVRLWCSDRAKARLLYGDIND